MSHFIVRFTFMTQTIGFLTAHFNWRAVNVYNNGLRFVERTFRRNNSIYI